MVVIIVVMLRMVVITMAHWQIPTSHKVGLCHNDQSWKCCDNHDYCDEDDDNDECDDDDNDVDLVNPASSRSQIGVHCRQACLK